MQYVRFLSENKHSSLILFSMSLYCFCFSILRFYLSGTKYFLFLNWNLFLAFVPWFFSTLLIHSNRLKKNPILFFFIILLWILFFPNAPYILTDLLHLKIRTPIPLWFDLNLILSFAFTGLYFGLISLLDIEIIMIQYLSKKITRILLMIFLFTGAFGIYLGRFLRLNSWDLFSDPYLLLYKTTENLSNSEQFFKMLGVSFTMGILLNFVFWTTRSIKRND
jgi:uncharacterized membrane protein